MARYTFTCEHFNYDEFTGDRTTVSFKNTTVFDTDELSIMIENFDLFLRGSGFVFDGELNSIMMSEDSLVNTSTIADESNFECSVWCDVCGISRDIMQHHNCFDKKCPKENW
jgi:hypothetical protein